MAPYASVFVSLLASLRLIHVVAEVANSDPTSHPTSLDRRGDQAVGDDWLPHNDVKPFPTRPDDALQEFFEPYIYSWHGCMFYPAVDEKGKHGAGLKPTGKQGGDCRKPPDNGQVYARTGSSHGRIAIMFAYYSPKIQSEEDHKHSWCAVVIWLHRIGCRAPADNSRGAEARQFHPVAVTYWTAENKFDATVNLPTLYAQDRDVKDLKTHPVIAYDGGPSLMPSPVGATPDALFPTLVGWDHGLTPEARNQLNGIQYEKTAVPLNDHNFQTNLDSAWNDLYFGGKGPEVVCPGVIQPVVPAPPVPLPPVLPAQPKQSPRPVTNTQPPTPVVDGDPWQDEGPRLPSELGMPDMIAPGEYSNATRNDPPRLIVVQ